jgi:hypothetical protein
LLGGVGADEALHTFYEESSVPRTVVDRHVTSPRQGLLESPEEVMAQLLFARNANGDDAHVAGV